MNRDLSPFLLATVIAWIANKNQQVSTDNTLNVIARGAKKEGILNATKIRMLQV